ncbi:uncharacterized protein LOC126615543 [Malus sylvestris]|uniref:uncharacterized protein LOC126615543 n=1 Tax=Malus sylvestris TaxID=3752 RepID=UPI0021ACB42E|nr:uncharacterized protein LOC126615543 [Malus sylvestris]
MERYFKRKTQPEILEPSPKSPKNNESSSKQTCVDSMEINSETLQYDPGLRRPILSYHPNVRDQVRRAYLQNKPCQPKTHAFPYTNFGTKPRRFNPAWFTQFPNWLEYSTSHDAAYCLCCYLFKPDIGDQSGGGDTFVGVGFKNWKCKKKLEIHVGGPHSSHNNAWRNCEALLNQKQHIETVISKQTDQDRIDYRTRLGASVGVSRILLQQGLPFRGHDESENSLNQGKFLEILRWLHHYNEGIKAVTLENAPENLKLTSPDIQKDISSAISYEIINAITSDINDSLFSILVDESRDKSSKEQMAIVLCFVDKGHVIERFVGIEHVADTKASSLKLAIDDFFSRHGLSISKLCGQGYDGASNMQGEFNGLKALILNENESAFYVHCFAHQLQLALVAVAKKNSEIGDLFTMVSSVVNIMVASSKRRDILREKHAHVILKALENNELSSGQGLNQETTLKRASDTRWSSHYNCLISLAHMFSSTIEVLEIVRKDGTSSEQKFEAKVLLTFIQSFNFIFGLHLMKKVLGITNDLSQALQKKDQDIVNAMNLVNICKGRLQRMRENGWESLFDEVSSFCDKNRIKIPSMDGIFTSGERPNRKAHPITNVHHYRVDLFTDVIDKQLTKLNDRFTEKNTELLLCVACLSPNLKGISDLAQKMVRTKKDHTYPLVYLLLTLALILPVATASVE